MLSRREGLPVRIVGRCGTVALEAAWDDGRLLQARLRLPDHREVVVRPDQARHPVLGPCHEVTVTDGPVDRPDGDPAHRERHAALFEAVDLASPDHIPAMDRPAGLPAGAGTAILGLVARRAAEQGVDALRYRGPYPTGALFDALLECFTVDRPPEAAARFVADAEAIALAARPVEVPVEFRPAPFERVWPRPDVCVQLRRGVERAWIEGRGYSALTAGARRIHPVDGGFVAVLELAGRVWGVVARMTAEGDVIDGPHALPPPPPHLCGRELPASIREALVRALPPRAPRLLQAPLQAVLEEAPIRWGDPGVDAASVTGSGIVLHAGILEHLAALPPVRILEEVAAAVEDPARRLAMQRLTPRR